ncbi:MAG: cation diffusion facilitator family transporter, partial [Clostridia bacterium]|nr:cation diffusion facilitator family transporter [Clostridia bacterium]
MTDFLFKMFIKDYKNTSNPSVRSAYGALSGIVGIICNVLLFIGKLLAGIVSGSVAVIADAVNNLSDASSSVVSLIGFRLAKKPADEGHPYGHGRYEYIAGLVVSLLIIIIGVELMQQSIGKIIHPEKIYFGLLSIVVLIASIIVKLWMMVFSARAG